jgi:hypothetical protein
MNPLLNATPDPTPLAQPIDNHLGGPDRLREEDAIGKARERDNGLWMAGYKAGFNAAMETRKPP